MAPEKIAAFGFTTIERSGGGAKHKALTWPNFGFIFGKMFKKSFCHPALHYRLLCASPLLLRFSMTFTARSSVGPPLPPRRSPLPSCSFSVSCAAPALHTEQHSTTWLCVAAIFFPYKVLQPTL